ncbi:MAG TPA: hypothetical protein PL130_06600 [Dictyoglomaceae bacterium]|nr:hypothetical protein [Dictyoglomaceae bacterium]HPU44044.1 hypothetical protein [Dictyoglomaceae bacterium]
MINLDYLCTKIGQEIGENGDESTLRKALGVLQEDGVYAMFLWLEKENNEIRKKLTTELKKSSIVKKYLLQNSDGFHNDFKEFCKDLSELSQDIDKLFFLKKILERSLTYALYHAKVKGEENVAET